MIWNYMNNSSQYLDYAATTPVDIRVLESMLPYFSELFGNPNSSHIYGKKPKLAIDKARLQVAELINSNPNEVYFTSGATESINWALKGYCENFLAGDCHIITVETEHKAVLNTVEYLSSKGYSVTYLKVDSKGLISLDDLTASIQPNTKVVSIMYVNNEIGIIQKINEIGAICRKRGITFFTDATQAAGKTPIDVFSDNIDLMAFSAHKFYGPKGIGALYIRKGINVGPLLHGGSQENGFRGGTYNTPLIVGMGMAAELAKKEFDSRLKKTKVKRNTIIRYYENNNLGKVNFDHELVSPYIISMGLNCDAEEFLLKHQDEFVASTGSACSSGIIGDSHVLKALGLQGNTIRISL